MAPLLFRNFFFPTLDKRYFLRLAAVGVVCYLVFGYMLIPLRIQGQSMEPTYSDGSFAFSWRLQYLFAPPERFDIVTIRFSGRGVMLLKRIVALPDETVEFRKGQLYVDGSIVQEPYVRYRTDWELRPRKVAAGHIYVVGDNRGTSMDDHKFGEVAIERIVGGVL